MNSGEVQSLGLTELENPPAFRHEGWAAPAQTSNLHDSSFWLSKLNIVKCQTCGELCAAPAGDDNETQPVRNGKSPEAEVSAVECCVDIFIELSNLHKPFSTQIFCGVQVLTRVLPIHDRFARRRAIGACCLEPS